LFASLSSAGQVPPPPPQPGAPATGPTVATPGMPGAPRRDPTAQQQEPGTGVIKGRVVVLDTGAPLRRVQIRLTGGTMRQSRGTMTDAQGQYEFKDLIAGRYNLFASKGGYVSLSYGQRGPKDTGKAIELADKQTMDKVDLALPRGAVITGRVVDETGEAVSEVQVTAMQFRMMNGKRRLTPA